MKLIIHDLLDAEILFNKFSGDDYYFIPANGPKSPCFGCFGCWMKTPGKCVIKDRLKNLGAILAACDELIIISKSQYGGYDAEVKNILDRSIPYLLPFFRNIKKKQHHKPRYSKNFHFTNYIYSDKNINSKERRLIQDYINAVSINFNCQETKIHFINDLETISS